VRPRPLKCVERPPSPGPGATLYTEPMVTTVVLATCDIHRVPETAQAIADLPEVSEVYSVAGDYDLVIMVRVREHEELARVVTEGIAKVPGVERTQTLVAFKVYSHHDVEAMFSVGLEEEAL
jgi:DNA-binding Lrp family transcriptional regulator